MPASTTFNEACYLARYPDVKANWRGLAIDHYTTGGGKQQGRVPGCDLPGTVYSTEFNEEAYLARYPDVKLLWRGTAYDHFYNAGGQQQGRVPGYEIITGDLPPNSVVTPGTVIFKPAPEVVKEVDPAKPVKPAETPGTAPSELTAAAMAKKSSQSKYIIIGLCSLFFVGIIIVIAKRKQIFG